MKEYLRNLAATHPSLLGALCLGGGVCAAHVCMTSESVWLWLGIFLSLIAAFAAILLGCKKLLILFSLLSFFLIGIHVYVKQINELGTIVAPENPVSVMAEVRKIWSTSPGSRVIIVDRGFLPQDGTRLPSCGRVTLRDNDADLGYGDLLVFRSKIRLPENRGNPGEYDWETDCKSNGISWLASVKGMEGITILKKGRPGVGAALFTLRNSLTKVVDASSGIWLDEQHRLNVRAIHKAVLLGDMGEVSPYINRIFADSGLIHALSASGVHMSMVAFLVLIAVWIGTSMAPSLMLWFPRRKIVALVFAPAAIGYCYLVGARVPPVRAAVMGLVAAVAILIDKRWNSLNSLGVAAILALLWSPLSLMTPSFQLSFLAVAGIFISTSMFFEKQAEKSSIEQPHSFSETEPSQKKFTVFGKLKQGSLGTVQVSLGALLAVTPLLLNLFHSFPTYSVLSNLLTDILMTASLCLGFLGAFAGLIRPELGYLFFVPADYLVYIIIIMADFFSGLPHAVIRVGNVGVCGLLSSFVACGCLLALLVKPTRRSALLLVPVSVVFLGGVFLSEKWNDGSNKAVLVFLNVGKGDSAFIKTPGLEGLLVDAGPAGEYFDSGRSIVDPFLRWKGNRSLDFILISHPHLDHWGGVSYLLQQFMPPLVLWNQCPHDSGGFARLLKQIQVADIKIETVNRTSNPVKKGQLTVNFLNRPGDSIVGNSSNANLNMNKFSAVCRLDYVNFSFLLVGDLERDGEDELLKADMPLKAVGLKVGHHGGNTGTTARFLDAVRPKIAVVSAEYPSKKGGLSQETLQRLHDVGAQVYLTGKDGAITIETDGKETVAVVTGKTGSVRNYNLN
jgi:competence protein ComEC